MKNLISRCKRMGFYDVVSNVIVFILALASLSPLLWLITNSVKTSPDIYKMPPDWIPKYLYFGNFVELFQNQPALRWTMNSFIISFTTTALTVLFSSLAAYAFAKLKFKGSNFIFYLFVGSLMIPKETFIVPLFNIIVHFNWLKNIVGQYAALIVPNLATGFGVFMLKGFFEQIPDSIRESAKIDGASEWKIFVRLMLPIAKPGIGALFILNFVTVWNDYLWQLLMTQDKLMNTLPVGIAGLMQDLNPNLGLKVAGAAVGALPMLIIFVLFQQYFTKGITAGAVKE